MKPGKQGVLRRWSGVICALIWLGAQALQAGFAAAVAPVAASSTNVEPDLLEPERAFQLSARRKDHKTVELEYKIAEGYYMYKGRFKFAVEPPASVKLGKAVLSKGKMKQDATFGRVETYRDSVRILLPITSFGKGNLRVDDLLLRLSVTSQGCADAGICYPPLHQTLKLPPSGFDVVLPDGVVGLGSVAGRLQSTPESKLPSLIDSLKKTK